jgi:selenocysteine lyase/cysteine desulfurase
MIGVDNGPGMVEQLAEQRVFVDCRPRVGLRMSPHFFNTDEEIEEALHVLAKLLKR